MKLDIIIVTYNNAAAIASCLRSLEKGKIKPAVFVVDNASTDETVEIVKKFPEVKLIQNRQNLGFAAASNQALKKAKGEFILLLNPDSEVKRGAIARMVGFMERNPKVGIVGPTVRMVFGNEQILTGGGRVNPLFSTAGYLKFEKLPREPMEVDYVTGAALMIRREVIEKIGFMPEEYFLYYEDTDWCLRARRVGYKVVYYPKAEVRHYEGSSFKGDKGDRRDKRDRGSFKQIYYGAKSGLMFGRRWTPVYLKPLFWLIVATKFLKRLLINGPSSPQFLAALDFLRGRLGERVW